MDKRKIPLKTLIDNIIKELETAGFSHGTIGNYIRYYKRLTKLADTLGKVYYDQELAEQFIADNAYHNGGGYCHLRYLYHARCIHFVESYIEDGKVDWGITHPLPPKALKSPDLEQKFNEFKVAMVSDGLKPNTREGYQRFVFYFLSYLEDKGYRSLEQIKKGDITLFIVLVCQEHYAPTSLGAHLTGLRRFVQMFSEMKDFEQELPERLHKKKEIIPTYTDEEHERISKYLSGNALSARNRAIALIAFETGLRAVDICNLKLKDIDWKHDVMNLIQEKTGKAINIPILPTLGNALMDYLLDERPSSNSEYVFLEFSAPFRPLSEHSAIYNILRKVLVEAGVDVSDRISGTRMTRHSYASRMLRNGVALPVISEALGHSNPDSTMRYITTDGKTLAECTLPIPRGGQS